AAAEVVVAEVDAERRDEAASVEAEADERRGGPRSRSPDVAVSVEVRELPGRGNGLRGRIEPRALVDGHGNVITVGRGADVLLLGHQKKRIATVRGLSRRHCREHG